MWKHMSGNKLIERKSVNIQRERRQTNNFLKYDVCFNILQRTIVRCYYTQSINRTGNFFRSLSCNSNQKQTTKSEKLFFTQHYVRMMKNSLFLWSQTKVFFCQKLTENSFGENKNRKITRKSYLRHWQWHV